MRIFLALIAVAFLTTAASCHYHEVKVAPKHHSSHEDKPKVEKPKDNDCRK
jgi:hypothetical protein